MQEQPRRKPRIPLSPEELFYMLELRKLKQAQKLQSFKASNFYKTMNVLNVVFVAFVTYCILSIIILSVWEKTSVVQVKCSYERYSKDQNRTLISELEMYDVNGNHLYLKTSELHQCPQKNDVIYLGRDVLFGKILKVSIGNNANEYWTVFSYASICLSIFAVLISFFIYKVNMHLTIHGLIMSFALLMLATLYFVLI